MGYGNFKEGVVVKVALLIGLAVMWLGQAVGLARLMDRRGFHPLPWFTVAMFLGPALWPLVVIEAVKGPRQSELLRRGAPGTGKLDVFVALDRGDQVPEEMEAHLRRLMPVCRRLVLARVVKAGGPTHITFEAERFLRQTASRLGARGAELRLFYGNFDSVVGTIQDHGGFDLVLRGDQPGELLNGHGSRQERSSRRDVTAA